MVPWLPVISIAVMSGCGIGICLQLFVSRLVLIRIMDLVS